MMKKRHFIRHWGKTSLLALIACAVFISGLSAYAQDDPNKRYLTWDDSPLTNPIRHAGDTQVRWGWESSDKVLGPFYQSPFQVGERTQFIIWDDFGEDFELYYASEYAYFWFHVGSMVDMDALAATAARFDSDIWPLTRYLYGENATPGIDGDARIHIVNLESLSPGLAGYFSPSDQCSHDLCDGSNERDAIYLILDYGPLNTDRYFSTLTHEFQHLIQFNVDGNEYRWLDEGLSQLAEHLNGFSEDPINADNMASYLSYPNILLDSWTFDYGQSGYYGAGYLMTVYLYERFGVDFIRDLARSPYDGLASIHHSLQQSETGVDLNELMLDWWLANLIDNPYSADGRYYYQTLDLEGLAYIQWLDINQETVYRDLSQQYGVRYLEISEAGTYQLEFSGDTEAPLTLISPHSGDGMWWSYNSPSSATSLTREIDLSSVDKATLKYWIAGETGDFPGYLQVMVSNDGEKWDLLRGSHMQYFTHFSEAPGPHYAGSMNEWQADFIDLSKYAGQVIQLRFEYITTSITGHGFMLDDISVPEIGWKDTVETLDEAWIVEGFIHTQGVVKQDWGLAVVNNGDTPTVQRIAVENGEAQAAIEVGADGAVIVVGAMAPFTPLEAHYSLHLSQ